MGVGVRYCVITGEGRYSVCLQGCRRPAWSKTFRHARRSTSKTVGRSRSKPRSTKEMLNRFQSITQPVMANIGSAETRETHVNMAARTPVSIFEPFIEQ